MYAFHISLVHATRLSAWHDHPNNMWLSSNIAAPHFAVLILAASFGYFPNNLVLKHSSLSVGSEKNVHTFIKQ
jgi:hypothetical protein